MMVLMNGKMIGNRKCKPSGGLFETNTFAIVNRHIGKDDAANVTNACNICNNSNSNMFVVVIIG